MENKAEKAYDLWLERRGALGLADSRAVIAKHAPGLASIAEDHLQHARMESYLGIYATADLRRYISTSGRVLRPSGGGGWWASADA